MNHSVATGHSRSTPRRQQSFRFPLGNPGALAILALALFLGFVIYLVTRPVITIKPRETLVEHLGTNTAATIKSVKIARSTHLPVYHTPIGGVARRVSYEDAFVLAKTTDWDRLDVRVYPGDHFDLRFGTRFTAGPGSPAPERR